MRPVAGDTVRYVRDEFGKELQHEQDEDQSAAPLAAEGRARIEEHHDSEAGGDPACWAGLLCPECATVAGGGYHRPGCPLDPHTHQPTDHLPPESTVRTISATSD